MAPPEPTRVQDEQRAAADPIAADPLSRAGTDVMSRVTGFLDHRDLAVLTAVSRSVESVVVAHPPNMRVMQARARDQNRDDDFLFRSENLIRANATRLGRTPASNEEMHAALQQADDVADDLLDALCEPCPDVATRLANVAVIVGRLVHVRQILHSRVIDDSLVDRAFTRAVSFASEEDLAIVRQSLDEIASAARHGAVSPEGFIVDASLAQLAMAVHHRDLETAIESLLALLGTDEALEEDWAVYSGELEQLCLQAGHAAATLAAHGDTEAIAQTLARFLSNQYPHVLQAMRTNLHRYSLEFASNAIEPFLEQLGEVLSIYAPRTPEEFRAAFGRLLDVLSSALTPSEKQRCASDIAEAYHHMADDARHTLEINTELRTALRATSAAQRDAILQSLDDFMSSVQFDDPLNSIVDVIDEALRPGMPMVNELPREILDSATPLKTRMVHAMGIVADAAIDDEFRRNLKAALSGRFFYHQEDISMEVNEMLDDGPPDVLRPVLEAIRDGLDAADS